MIKFTKMHGIGNDYVYINAMEENLPSDLSKFAIKISKEHFGCGSDGLILIFSSNKADFKMRMFNKDGSESEMCGNGIRCVAAYCHDRELTQKTQFSIESGGKIKHVSIALNEQGKTEEVTINMGEPITDGKSIPSTLIGNPVVRRPIPALGKMWEVTLVNMSNPHAVIFVDDITATDVEKIGSAIENSPLFPNKINVEFVHVIDSKHIEMRVWERGSGETLACGTGACASVVASILNNYVQGEILVDLLGGKLKINWNKEDNNVYMTGPATFVYDGTWLLD